jgi:translation initiation factor 1
MANSKGKNMDITGMSNVPKPKPEKSVSAEPISTTIPMTKVYMFILSVHHKSSLVPLIQCYLYIMAQQKKKMNLSDLGGLVYSTGSMPLQVEEQVELAHAEQNLRVWLEKNHRGGKIACVIKGFVGSDEALEELAKFLKMKCGTGGSAKDGEIVIQGDHREKIVQLLLDKGYPTKKAGA